MTLDATTAAQAAVLDAAERIDAYRPTPDPATQTRAHAHENLSRSVADGVTAVERGADRVDVAYAAGGPAIRPYTRSILLEVGRPGLDGALADMIIDIALHLQKQAQTQIHTTEAVYGP
ncbi:hypothetical protein ACWEKR_33940 [Nocardia sp. NPDC004573]